MCGLFVVAVALLCVVGEWGAGPLFAEHCGRYASVQTYKLFPPTPFIYTQSTPHSVEKELEMYLGLAQGMGDHNIPVKPLSPLSTLPPLRAPPPPLSLGNGIFTKALKYYDITTLQSSRQFTFSRADSFYFLIFPFG